MSHKNHIMRTLKSLMTLKYITVDRPIIEFSKTVTVFQTTYTLHHLHVDEEHDFIIVVSPKKLSTRLTRTTNTSIPGESTER